jgi:bifunctional DNA-binding transcriptional regulator/antitoxin component of YhaV-PrlF toxin-antitoxin module
MLCCYAAMLMRSHYVSIQARGTIALPPDLRRRLHLDEPGAQVRLIERDDGVVELQPVLPVPADQRWFWSERWQAMEREVDEHVAAGRVTTVDGIDELLDHLAGTGSG